VRVFLLAFGHAGQLLFTRWQLVPGFPFGIGHIVNNGAAIVFRHIACLGNPVSQTVAAKARKAHQINILGIRPMLEVADKAAERYCCRSVIKLVYVHVRGLLHMIALV
jgi:hypothetical protein